MPERSPHSSSSGHVPDPPSALVLYEYTSSDDDGIHAVRDNRVTSFSVFKGEIERYVEPNESIEVQQFISFPRSLKVAYRLEADITSASGFAWSAACM